jgi:WD40 repeat protein
MFAACALLWWTHPARAGSCAAVAVVGAVLAAYLMQTRAAGPLWSAEHLVPIYSVTFSPDGRVVASGAQDATITVRDARTGKEIGCLVPPEGAYPGADAAKGGVYDPLNGKRPPWPYSVSFCKDGKELASGNNDRTIRLWDVARKKQVRKFELEPSGPLDRGNPVSAVSISPDAKLVASASFDGVVRLWSTATGKPARALRDGQRPMYAAAFSPDGKVLAAAGYDGVIRFWEPSTGKLRDTLKGHTGFVRSLSFSQDGRLLASGAGQLHGGVHVAEIFLWDVARGERLVSLAGHEEPVHSVALSPDGTLLVSGGGDAYGHKAELLLWDVARRRVVERWRGHSNVVVAVAFSPDGRYVASASQDRTVKVWTVPAGHSGGGREKGPPDGKDGK